MRIICPTLLAKKIPDNKTPTNTPLAKSCVLTVTATVANMTTLELFGSKVGQIMRIQSRTENEGRFRTYKVSGQIFFASAERFINAFDYKEVIDKVRIDVSRAHFWDITAVEALDKVLIKFQREAIEVEVVGLNQASATIVDKFTEQDKDVVEDMLKSH